MTDEEREEEIRQVREEIAEVQFEANMYAARTNDPNNSRMATALRKHPDA